MAGVMRAWQEQGVTLASVRYVIDQVFWKELAAENEHAAEVARVLRSEVRSAIASGTPNKHDATL